MSDDGNDSDYEDLPAPEDDERDSIKNRRWKKVVKEGLVVPYRTFHSPSQSFKTPNRKCFIPGRPVSVKIIDIQQTHSTHLLNPNLYVIQITHGDHTWTVKRRYKHFQHLHQQLQLYRVTLSVPFPSRTHRERRSSYKSSLERDEATGKSRGLPRFPKRPEALVAADQLDQRKEVLEKYLQDLLKIRAFRNHHETLEFLEVSHLSFVHGLGCKGKEGLVLKRTGANRSSYCSFRCCFRCHRCCGDWCSQWQRRWLVVKESFVAYVRPKDGHLHCVMLFDNEFEVSKALYEAGVQHGVVVSNLSRQLVVKCWTKRRAKEWLEYLKKITTTEIAKGFIEDNRFASFAPIRREIEAHWFVDGSSYMSAIADVLESAHEEIMICDWWLSPEIYMKRPVVEGERWRLDKILQRKAKEGVKIFIMLYKEVNLALGINSFYSKQKLVEAHPENIKVMRHPDHVKSAVLLWAHHEKLVIVDQTYAFVGGIDLCYGRWDDQKHRLTDLGSVSTQQKPGSAGLNKLTSSKPGGGPNHSILHLAKATNAVTISTLVENPDMQQISKTVTNQILEDESLQTGDTSDTAGPSEVDESYLDIKAVAAQLQNSSPAPQEQLPNGNGREAIPLHESESVMTISKLADAEDNNNTPLKGETPPTGRRAQAGQLLRRMTKMKKVRDLKDEGKDWIKGRIRGRAARHRGDGDDTTSSDNDSDDENKRGHKDATDNVRSDENVATPKSSKVAKKRTKRSAYAMSNNSHTQALEGLQGSSKLWIGKDYTNFIVKDFADLESPFTDLVDRSTTPRMPWHDMGVFVQGNAARDVARHFIQRWNGIKEEKARVNRQYPFLIPKAYDLKNESVPTVLFQKGKLEKVSCQVIRSVSQWSAGISNVEDSIQQAYVDSIHNAKHYVYMENQFFISLAAPNNQVQNRIGEALLNRILHAHREGKVFRVFVVIPLLPGFEGEVGTSRGQAIHAITHWNYASIARGNDSLIMKLQKAGIEDPTQYVSFHGLRTWSELHGDLVTELIYVHSKLMIIDDNLVICGSANINDRSMLGKRDSEVGVILQDEVEVQSKMNGADYKAGRFARSLRMNLFREHLGLFDDNTTDITDPISDDFYQNVWLKTSNRNTEIFDEVFHCIPTDHCETFAKLRQFQETHSVAATDPARARKMLQDIKGYLVSLPVKFLCQEHLLPAAGTREALMPSQLWT